MKQWWSQLQSREKMLVIAMSTLVGIFILYRMIWQPIVESHENETKKLARNQALLQYVTQNVVLVKNNSGHSKQTGNLSTTINRIAKQQGITITRVQPQAADISVWIDQVSFNQLLGFLHQLTQQHGIEVKGIDISQTDDSGLVKVRRLQLGKN